MAKRKTTPTDTQTTTRFTIDLGQVKLTAKEVNSLRNQITKLAVESARKKGGPAARKRGPFVKIIHVKQIHSKVIH